MYRTGGPKVAGSSPASPTTKTHTGQWLRAVNGRVGESLEGTPVNAPAAELGLTCYHPAMLRRSRQVKPSHLNPAFPFVHAVDIPHDRDVAVHSMPLRGWIAVPPTAVVAGPWVEHGARVPLEAERRADVEQVFPDSLIVAFRDLLAVDEHAASQPWELVLSVDGKEFRTGLDNVQISHDEWAEFEAAKRRKLARIQALLRCPVTRRGGGTGSSLEVCGGEFEAVSFTAIACSRCGREFPRNDRQFDMLGSEHTGAVFTTQEDSVHTAYGDLRTIDLIAEVTAAGGLILDNGSGFKREYLENVVNFDIVDFATTDVLGTGGTLPFADKSFDAVLSFSVLEHVRDPFQCASEIDRVLKPGGLVQVSVPHLAPYHGFPSHYYNMTRQGLEALFVQGFHVESSETPDWGHPIQAITWILQLYAAGLPPESCEEFGRLRVDELMGWGFQYLDRQFVTDLDVETRRVLACNNFLVARKVSRDT